MNNSRSNKIWIDNARIIACFTIVFLHVASSIVYHDPVFGSAAYWAGNIYNSFARWSVPFFLMISGALLLDPARSETACAFYRKRAGRILAPLLFWTLFYSILRFTEDTRIGAAPGLELVKLAKDICSGNPYYHLWYLYMLVGLYLFMPIVRFCVKSAPAADLRLLCAVWFIIAITTSAAWSFSGPHTEKFSFFLGSFFNFMPYCLAGFLIAGTRGADARRATLLPASVALGMGLCTLVFTHALHGKPAEEQFYFYSFISITTVPLALALFSLAPRLSRPVIGARLNGRTAALTLGIYLVHPAALKLLASFGFTATSFNPFFAVPALAIAAFAASGLFTSGIAAIPGLKKIIG
jgi:surface polysaccharide O-acyltransferase-like enzyme